MKKGITNAVIQILGAIIILMFSAYVFWSFVYGREHVKPKVESNSGEEQGEGNCLTDDNCEYDHNGAKCGDWADPNFPERIGKFCGCDTNEDCKSTPEVKRGGVCGQDNKCS